MGGSKYTAGHFSVINNKYYFEKYIYSVCSNLRCSSCDFKVNRYADVYILNIFYIVIGIKLLIIYFFVIIILIMIN